MAEANFCRLCAEQKDSFVGIYEEEGLKLKLEYKIAKCLQIELCLKDPLPKTVCLDCCAKLNQCSDFFDTSAEAQVALCALFRRPKEEERRISGNQLTETQPENFLCTLQAQESHQEGNNFCNDAAEKNLEQLPNRSPLLDNNSPDYYEGETEHSSRRKRRLPQRCSLELKIGTTDHEIVSSQKTFCSPSSVTSTKCLQTEVAQERYDTMETEDKVCTEDIPEIDSLSCGRMSEDQNPDVFKVMGETAHKTGDNAGANSRKRRDGWEKYPWMCTDCSLELPSMQALRSHHQTVHNQPPRFMCAQCSKVYTKYYGFVSHVRRHRNHMKFCCEECGKCFSNKKVLESHRATHSDARPFVCTECGKSFRQQSALYVHNRSHMPESIKNRYPCDQCDKRFSTKPNLVTHKRIHTGIRNFTCDQCGKSFIQKGNLDAHLLTHSADKPHICSVCNKGFKTPLQLRKHQSVHTGAKPHQCDVCGRQFRERGTLREHHRIHTGAMPFTCEFCGKSFRFKGILTTHRRQHTGERPYSCLECQHHFTNWPNYNKHMKRRHGINTSHQPDPNKIALANMAAVNTANTNSGILVTSSTSQTNPASATMLVLHPPHHLQTEHQQAPPAAPTEHCPSILGFPADAMDNSTGQFNNHAGTDTLSAHGAVCSVSDGDTHLHVVERMGAHFYSAPSTAPPHVSAYSATAPTQANVLSFYALPHQLTGLESASIDMMPPVQQR